MKRGTHQTQSPRNPARLTERHPPDCPSHHTLAARSGLERQLTVETYELGDGPLKLLFGDLPYQRVLALGKDDQPDRLAF